VVEDDKYEDGNALYMSIEPFGICQEKVIVLLKKGPTPTVLDLSGISPFLHPLDV